MILANLHKPNQYFAGLLAEYSNFVEHYYFNKSKSVSNPFNLCSISIYIEQGLNGLDTDLIKLIERKTIPY